MIKIIHKTVTKLTVLLTVSLSLFTITCFAQNQHTVDSLHTVLKKNIPDSVRADTYYYLAREYRDFVADPAILAANHNKAREYANQCFTLSEKCGYLRGMGDACGELGNVYTNTRKFIDALELFKKSLKYYRETKNDTLISTALFRMGYTYFELGDFEQALKYNFEALKLDEQRGDSAEAAGLYHNIGIIYYTAGNRNDAIANVKKALRINTTTGNKNWLAINYQMLGDYYFHDNIDESLQYYIESTKLSLALGNINDYAFRLVQVGKVLSYKKEYTRAIDTMQKALRILREVRDKNGIAWSYNHLGMSYTQQGKFKEAAVCLDSCLRLCKELGAPDAMRNVYERLYQLDSASGNLASAYTHYTKFINLRDSTRNAEGLDNVAKQQMRFEYSQKEEQSKAEQEKKDIQQVNIRNSIVGALAGTLIFLVVVYRQRNKVKKEKQNVEREKANVEREKARSDELLLNILPAEVAEELKDKGSAEAKHFNDVTVLFTDFKNFTTVSEQLSPQELVDELHTCFKAFDEIMEKYSIEKIKTIGDAYLAVCGLPISNEKHAENVVNAALEIREFMLKRRQELGEKTFEIRIGIHSGSVVAGIVGVKKFAYDIWGDTVNTAARMEQNSEAGKINISETTYMLVKDNFRCDYRGEIDAKNKGKLAMYFVERLR